MTVWKEACPLRPRCNGTQSKIVPNTVDRFSETIKGIAPLVKLQQRIYCFFGNSVTKTVTTVEITAN